MRSRQAIGRMEVAAETNSRAAMKAPAKAVAAWRLELKVADIGNPLFELFGPTIGPAMFNAWGVPIGK